MEGIQTYFQVPQIRRMEFIDQKILNKIECPDIEGLRERIENLIGCYEGLDQEVLDILSYAAQKNSLDQFAERLEGYFSNELIYLSPESRRFPDIPGVQ